MTSNTAFNKGEHLVKAGATILLVALVGAGLFGFLDRLYYPAPAGAVLESTMKRIESQLVEHDKKLDAILFRLGGEKGPPHAPQEESH